MDKDNRDDFTFAKLSDLKLPVTFRMLETSPDYRANMTLTSHLDHNLKGFESPDPSLNC